MSWQIYVKSAESVLESTRIPTSEELISLIKRINPTSLHLSECDREHGYRIKNRLQSLLLENYGEAFHLVPHPYSPEIILIKHNALPSVDACHANLNTLSAKALDTVGDLVSPPAETAVRNEAKPKAGRKPGGRSPREVLGTAELHLEQYEYPQAEEILASLRITTQKDLPVLIKAARMLVEEMGAYERAIEVLLAQPRPLLKDKTVRELLAMTYYGNGMIPEARALFDAAHPDDFGKSALFAYADISFKDGNLSQAYHLLKLSEAKEGFVTTHATLRKEIEAAMLEEAAPFFEQAQMAFGEGDSDRTQSLLQQALSLYPNFQKARQLAGEIEAGKIGAELDKLWRQFEAAETAGERLDLLAQLLERDKEKGEKVRNLMLQERSRQKKELLEDRQRTLENFTARESWGECFDILLWLSRQGEEAQYQQACRISPYFSVLHQNKRIQRLSDEAAKELWLGFLRLKGQVQEGQAAGCWELAQQLKPYFHSYSVFREDYDRVLEVEQDRAIEEVERLLDRLRELCRQEEPGDALAEARRLVAHIRREAAVLPAEFNAAYKQDAERVLRCLEPGAEESSGFLEYRDALILGSPKAAELRESEEYSWVGDYLRKMEEEVAELFAISAEPIPLTVSPDLVVDLATETASDRLEYMCSSSSHLLFREDDETIVVVNVSRMSATRYRSPNFKDLGVMDFLPEQDLFLFVTTSNNNTMWRAKLCDSESRFTSRFNINEHFYFQAHATFTGLFMSCAKDNVYYAVIGEGDVVRVVKQTVDLASTVLTTFEIQGELKDSHRLSNRPDRFVVITDSKTTVLESNLTQPPGHSRVGANQMLLCLGVDPSSSRIYAQGEDLVNVLNHKLFAVKQYRKTESIAHFEVSATAFICVEKDTVLLNLKGTGIFYNMQTDKFSQKFSLSRLLRTATPSRWYYLEFNEEKPEIRIKDITDDVDTLLEWKVLLTDDREESVLKFVETLNDPECFTVVKRAGQP